MLVLKYSIWIIGSMLTTCSYRNLRPPLILLFANIPVTNNYIIGASLLNNFMEAYVL